MAKTTEHISGTFQRVFYHNAENDYLVGQCLSADDKLATFVFTGSGKPEHFVPGLTYDFYGSWRTHPSYGKQFGMTSYVQCKPLSREEVVTYLIKYAGGIGEKIAGALFDKFGADALVKLRRDPEACAAAVGRLSDQKAKAASAELKKIQLHEETRARLLQMFAGRGIASSAVDQCIKTWGAQAPDTIQKRPYILLDYRIKRIGFQIADRMFLDFGGKPDSPERARRLLVYILESDTSGSTWIDVASLKHLYYQQMRGESLNFESVLQDCAERGSVQVNDKDNIAAATREYELERRLAGEISRVLGRSPEREAVPVAAAVSEPRTKRKFRW